MRILFGRREKNKELREGKIKYTEVVLDKTMRVRWTKGNWGVGSTTCDACAGLTTKRKKYPAIYKFFLGKKS